MQLQRRHWPKWTLAGLAAILVSTSLWSTGGLAAARAEKRDERRHGDLTHIVSALSCRTSQGLALPDVLDEMVNDGSAGCMDDVPTHDPFTGAPYIYEPLGEPRYRLCAGFEQPGRLAGYPFESEVFEPETGCIEMGVIF